MSKPDFISLMSELCSDLPADESTPCKIQYFDDYACIIDQQNKIWVKLTPNGSKVAFKIFSHNIPTAYIGEKTQEKIEGTILCESSEEANLCISGMLALIENGYGEKGHWLLGLDMEDLANSIFDGTTIKFLHKTIHFPPDEETMKEIKSKVKDSIVVLASFIIPAGDSWGWVPLETVTDEITGEMKAESMFWWQVSLVENSKDCTLDIWYR